MSNSTACNPWKATGNGAWAGDSPIQFALPLVTIQLCLILFFSRLLALLLRRLHQPRVIAEICGGVILGASCLGTISGFTETIFPPASLPVLTTLANLGLLFFLFSVGLELDLRTVLKTGKSSLVIAAAGIAVPFSLGIGVSFVIRAVLGIESKFAPFLVFMGVAYSITAFPVLARILAERKLLTTDVGQMAMSAAAVDDVVAWVLLALAVALSASGTSPTVAIWILLCGVAFVLAMFMVVRPLMALMCSQVVDNEPVPEWIVATTFVGVLISAFTTEVIGIHGIFGTFVFGLIVPKDGPFASLILEKIEDLTTIVLLPLYFASAGLSVRLQSISSAASIGLMFLVIGVACAGKIGGIVAAAMLNKVPFRKALVLGVLMNTKGLVELIVLNIGLQKKVINQELYSIMVVMALVTTFMTTPLVMWLYEPAREKRSSPPPKVESSTDAGLRLLVCVHGMNTIPPMLNLTEVTRGSRKRPLKAFMLHLVEFSERSSAIMMVTRVRRDGKPFWNLQAEREGRDQVAVAFQAYSRLSKVQVQAMTAISAFSNMHEDVCGTAADKRANLIILPYHKYTDPDGRRDTGVPGFQVVNQRVMRAAPCSVAIFVNRGFGSVQTEPDKVSCRVAVFFFGGPDDREALAVGKRMAEHPGLAVTVIHFVPREGANVAVTVEEQIAAGPKGAEAGISGSAPEITHPGSASRSLIISSDPHDFEREAARDMEALSGVEKHGGKSLQDGGAGKPRPAAGGQEEGQLFYDKREVDDAVSAALEASGEEFDLVIVGRGRRPAPLVALAPQGTPPRPASRSSEIHGLGPIGEALVSQEATGRQPSLLVVQQHDPTMVVSGKSGGGAVEDISFSELPEDEKQAVDAQDQLEDLDPSTPLSHPKPASLG